MLNENKIDRELILTYDVSSNESLSEGVIAAVSAVSDTSPIPDTHSEDEQPLDPLYTVIDPEALDSVFRGSDHDADRTSGWITFDYHGYEVTVHSEGWISVRRSQNRATSEAATPDATVHSQGQNSTATSVETDR
jgi:hypothetical protein